MENGPVQKLQRTATEAFAGRIESLQLGDLAAVPSRARVSRSIGDTEIALLLQEVMNDQRTREIADSLPPVPRLEEIIL